MKAVLKKRDSQLATLTAIEQRLLNSDLETLKRKVATVLDRVPRKEALPEWDKV